MCCTCIAASGRCERVGGSAPTSVSTQDWSRVAGVLRPPEARRASKVLKTATLEARSRKKNSFSAFGPFWPARPLKTKRIFKQNKTKHGAPARRGSHLRNNATVKLDGVPNGSDAPRSSLRCYAGESCDWRHPVPCLSVHLSVRSHTRTQHICFRKRIARPC